jgi:hypothetical protein
MPKKKATKKKLAPGYIKRPSVKLTPYVTKDIAEITGDRIKKGNLVGKGSAASMVGLGLKLQAKTTKRAVKDLTASAKRTLAAKARKTAAAKRKAAKKKK